MQKLRRQCFLVAGIEFLQGWFPIRTQSLNDIAAGCIGALLGPLIWFLTGRWTVNAVRNIYNQGINRNRLWHAALLYTTVNLVYSALPLDFVISVAELEQKYDLGRLEIVPDIHNVRALIKPFALTALRAFPLT